MKANATRKTAALAFASKLNGLLLEMGISRRELARRWAENTGSSFETARTNVHRLLRADHVPNESTRIEVAEALGIDRAELEEAALSGEPFRDGSRGGSAGAGRGASRTAEPDEAGEVAA